MGTFYDLKQLEQMKTSLENDVDYSLASGYWSFKYIRRTRRMLKQLEKTIKEYKKYEKENFHCHIEEDYE